MIRHGIFGLILAALAAAPVSAQSPWRFKWEKGQVLTYKSQHATNVTEVVDNAKSESGSKLTLVKRWVATEVDAQGNATLEMSLLSLRNEQKRPNGEILLFDSQDIEKSTPAMKGMAKFIGKTLHWAKVNPQGQTIDCPEELRPKFEAEPPFVIVVPGNVAPQEGQAWQRPFASLDPVGGEKIQFAQKFACGKTTDGKVVLNVSTELKSTFKTPSDRVPFLHREIEGQAVFDVERGVMVQVQLSTDRTVEEHQGKGSSYRYVSTFVEQLQPAADPKVVPAGNP